MVSNDELTGYKIWAVDNVVYGPAQLPILVNWVKEDRVTADTWVFSEKDDVWQKAAQVPELQLFFRSKPARKTSVEAAVPTQGLTPNFEIQELRKVKVFDGMDDPQLTRFMQHVEAHTVRQWATIVKQGDPGDAMYLILDGEVRVRLMIGGKESLLATLSSGGFFGEISLFDHGPRSADVIANTDCLLLKVSVGAFQKLANEFPDLTSPFLLAMGKTMTGRIRAGNKRYSEFVTLSQAMDREQ